MQANRHSSGFTLTELLIVMAVLLLFMTFIIPSLQHVNRRSNETAAIDSLRMINQMEGQYTTNYPQRGFACTLPTLGGKPTAAPSPAAAQLIPNDLATGNKAGYTFTLTCFPNPANNPAAKPTSYTLTALPNSPGHSGNRGFCTDQNAQIRYDPNGSTNCTELLQ